VLKLFQQQFKSSYRTVTLTQYLSQQTYTSICSCIPELTQQQNVDPTYQQHGISRHHQDLLLPDTAQPPKASTLSEQHDVCELHRGP